MDRRSSRSADQVPQLVERAQSLGASAGNRSRRFPRVVDGKFSVDAPGEGQRAFTEQKPMSDPEKLRRLDPKSVREHLKDGNYGGLYQRDDEEMMKIWRTARGRNAHVTAEEWD